MRCRTPSRCAMCVRCSSLPCGKTRSVRSCICYGFRHGSYSLCSFNAKTLRRWRMRIIYDDRVNSSSAAQSLEEDIIDAAQEICCVSEHRRLLCTFEIFALDLYELREITRRVCIGCRYKSWLELQRLLAQLIREGSPV